MSHVIVLGAGPAGLMAALAARRSGHDVTVLEAAGRVGGMAGSFEVAGQRVDFGSHRLHPATPAPVMAQLRQLLGDDLQVRPRSGRVRLADRWVGFPLRVGNLLGALPPPLTARLMADAARVGASALVPGRRRPANFADVVTARFGPTVTASFYGPYARKLYGLDPEMLDPELARRRIAARSPLGIAGRLVKAARPRGRVFLYPRRGYGQIAERLAEAAVESGVDLRLSSPVRAVTVDDRSAGVAFGPPAGPDGDADAHPVSDTLDDKIDGGVVDGGVVDGDVVDGDVVVSTIPVSVLARLVRPGPPDSVVDAMSRLRTRGMVLVYLALDRPRYTDFDAHYLPDPALAVARLSEPKNYRQGDDPPDRTVLCAEIACGPGDGLWSLDTDSLVELVRSDLDRVGLPASEPVATAVRRLRSVYPILDLAGAADRAVVARWRQPGGRLVTTGRQGLRALDNLHHVLEMGSTAAAAIGTDGLVDGLRWSAELERFATNVVED